MAACSSFASVGKLMAFGCTVVSTVTRLRSWLRNAPASCASRRLSASSSSSLSPSRLRQWLRSERSCGNACWKNSVSFRRLRIDYSPAISLLPKANELFDGHRLGEITRLVDIGSQHKRRVVRKKLQWQREHEWRRQLRHVWKGQQCPGRR
jgi:hypothetical protein